MIAGTANGSAETLSVLNLESASRDFARGVEEVFKKVRDMANEIAKFKGHSEPTVEDFREAWLGVKCK